MIVVSTTPIGPKKDRAYWLIQQSPEQTKIFKVKGVGKSFMLFDGEQHLVSFPTLTKCTDYVKNAT
jgi:hypothetical protein